MSTREEILEKLKSAKSSLMSKYPIESMALFGSYARSEQTLQSDIDILVQLNGMIGSQFIDLADDLEHFLNHKVDLISKNGIKSKYFESVQRDLIYV